MIELYINSLPQDLQKFDNVELIPFDKFLSQENNETAVAALLVPHKEFIDNYQVIKTRPCILDFGNFAI